MVALPSTEYLGRQARRLRASVFRDSFADYARYFWPIATGNPVTWNRAVADACAVLQRVADGELYRVLIAMPSGVGKSTILALYKAWRLARNHSYSCINMMHASSLANTESLRVRRLVESDEHRALYPELQLRADENTVQVWATTHGGRYVAAGRDTSLLGRRAQEGICDDPLDTLDRFSRSAKESLWAWFSESLMTRLDGARPPVIIVHQRLCIDDLIGRCLEQKDSNGNQAWTIVELPAEFEDGTLLAPTVLPRPKLDELKQRNPRAYAAMFLQKPSGDDGSAIGRSAWRFHAPAGANPNAARPRGCAKPEESPTVVTPNDFDALVISCDPTFGGTKTENDFCSIQVWGRAPMGDAHGYYLLARWKARAKQMVQREQLKVQREQFPSATLLIEKSAGGEGMEEELSAEGVQDIVLEGTGGLAKAARLDNVSPTIEQGFAFLPIGMVGLQDFVDELAGETRHDDDMDACSQALKFLKIEAGDDPLALMRKVNANLSALLR